MVTYRMTAETDNYVEYSYMPEGESFHEGIMLIPGRLGWSQLAVFAVGTVVGVSAEYAAEKIIKSEKLQEKRIYKHWVGVGFVLFFVLCELLTRILTGQTLLNTLAEEFIYVVVIPVVVFFIALLVSYLKTRRVKKRFGTGEQGYLADGKAKERGGATAGTNGEITGDYAANLAVRAENGTFVGFKDGKLVKFLGIPYASSERFRAPVKAEKSDGVFEARFFGPSPVQAENSMYSIAPDSQSEDCLCLNVFYKHSRKAQGRRAVAVLPMVGDFICGSAASRFCDPGELLKKNEDLLLVTFNFRTGVPGFTDMSGIPGGEAFPDAAELGVLDCIEALRWVKSNIAAFGGDEENITLIGSGAAGMITTVLAVSDRAKGLFNRAFIVSNYAGLITSAENKRAEGRMLAGYFGCRRAEELLSLTLDDIRRYSADPDSVTSGLSYGTDILPGALLDAYSSGAAKDVELVFCQASRDFGEWILSDGLSDTGRYIGNIYERMKENADGETLAFFSSYLDEKIAGGMTEPEAKRDLIEKLVFRATTLALADAQIKGGGKARVFYADASTDVELFSISSIYALCCFLGNKAAAEDLGLVFYNGAEEITGRMLRNFAVSGDPSVRPNEVDNVSAIPWPYFDGTDATVMSATDRGFKAGTTKFVAEAERFLPYVRA